MTKTKALLFAVTLYLSATSIFAADGQILINQASVIAAGGFPYQISQPGSYKLSGNLIVPAGVDGLHIAASHVTIDLNGFSISTATVDNTVAGIAAVILTSTNAPPVGIAIRNGVVSGFSVPVDSKQAENWALEELDLEWKNDVDIANMSFGAYTRINAVNAINMYLTLTCPSLVSYSTARAFFSASDGHTSIQNCAFTGNSTIK